LWSIYEIIHIWIVVVDDHSSLSSTTAVQIVMILFLMLLNKCKILHLKGLQYCAKESPVKVRVVCPCFLLFLCCWLASFKQFVMKQCFVDTQCI